MKNSTVLRHTSGSTSFFSCEYRPGATKAQTWYSTTGKASRKAAMNMIFSGTRNGEITEVAISVAPLGRWPPAARPAGRTGRPGRGRWPARRGGDGDGDDRLDQPVAQFDQVGDEGLLGAGQFVFLGFRGIRLDICWDHAQRESGHQLNLVRPVAGHARRARQRLGAHARAALYHCGVAPCFRRQFFLGCL
jgi:hypothetical protein